MHQTKFKNYTEIKLVQFEILFFWSMFDAYYLLFKGYILGYNTIINSKVTKHI